MKKLGKCIFISGLSFSGKTYLLSKLVSDFPDFKVVMYEHYFLLNSYRSGFEYWNMYKDVVKHITNEDNVFCESVYNHEKNKYVSIEFKESLNIICWPSFNEHLNRIKDFEKKFGVDMLKKRFVGDLSQARNSYEMPNKYILYNGNNYETIYKAVKEYVEH